MAGSRPSGRSNVSAAKALSTSLMPVSYTHLSPVISNSSVFVIAIWPFPVPLQPPSVTSSGGFDRF